MPVQTEKTYSLDVFYSTRFSGMDQQVTPILGILVFQAHVLLQPDSPAATLYAAVTAQPFTSEAAWRREKLRKFPQPPNRTLVFGRLSFGPSRPGFPPSGQPVWTLLFIVEPVPRMAPKTTFLESVLVIENAVTRPAV